MLSKANEGDGMVLKLMSTASIIEINLFGTMASMAWKPAYINNDSHVVLNPDQIGEQQKFKINMLPISVM